MPTAERRRLRAVDAFRGLVLAFMVLTPATGDPATFPLLRHATWDGATPSDLVFPTFLVTSGISLAFLLRPPTGRAVHRRLVRRTLLLILIGLAYNAYGATGYDLGSLRATGVLQTIGVSGAVTATVVLLTRRGDRDRLAVVAAVAAAITVAYWSVVEIGACEPVGACSPWFGLDEAVLGTSHTYQLGTRGFDPEGLAVTVAASALVVAGYLGGSLVRRAGLAVGWFAPRIAVLGAVGVLAGFALEQGVPFNKRLLSPSFVLLTSGVALLAFVAAAVLLDLPSRWGGLERARDLVSAPLVALGRNALVVFVLERLLLQTATFAHVGDRTAQQWLLDSLPVGEPGVHLAYTAVVLLVILAVVLPLHRRRWYLAL